MEEPVCRLSEGGGESSLHLMCCYDNLARQKFEICQVGHPTLEEIRVAALGGGGPVFRWKNKTHM